MTIVDLSKKPGSQMIEITLRIPKICFYEFSSCHLLKFTEEVGFVEGVQFLEKPFFCLGLLGRRRLRFFLHILI